MLHLHTSVASLTHPNIDNLSGLLSWHPTGTSGMPLLVVVVAMYLSVESIVIEVTLVAFRQVSIIWFCRY